MSQVKETNKLVTLSTSTNATVGASLLPQEVIAVLQKGPSEGYLTIPQRLVHLIFCECSLIYKEKDIGPLMTRTCLNYAIGL